MNKIKGKEKQNSEYDEEYEAPKKWYDNLAEDGDSKPVTEQILIDIKDEANKCLESETQNFKIKSSRGNSNGQWMKTIMNKGTLADKIAAHVVAIQDNPVFNLETLRNLLGMVKVAKKKECVSVMESLTELFINDLLLPNRKLRPFHQRPISQLMELSSGNAITRRKLLSLWYFEDQLKEIYTSFVLAVNTVSHDTVESNKEKAITAMYKLLAGNSEQEQNLLKYIVNKLGDPSPKVASKAIYCLTQLLTVHNNMQGVVLNEIEKVLFRPNISSRAQYYSLCFLSQFYLSHETSEVARKLIEVYFSFFKACVKQGEVDSRMMSVLLIGLKRAFPYAQMEMSKISEHIDTMYRIVQIASFNISLHALTLLYQVSSQGNNVNERFYNALYRKLFDPTLLVTTYQAMLLSLVYKALLKDTQQLRIKMFIKRLLQIALFTPPNFSTGILYLISQLMSKRRNLQSLLLVQIQPKNLDDDEEEENYVDVDNKIENGDDDNILDGIITNAVEVDDVKPDVEELNALMTSSSGQTNGKDIKPLTKYSPLARNPLYGGAQFCAYTELNLLKTHFHPTVALFAENILSGEIIKYNGDPLEDFTLIRFLDRFVFKNPKKLEEKAGVNPLFAKRKLYKAKGVKSLSVNSVNYLRESSNKIPADELFLHEFLQRRYMNKQAHVKEEDDDSDLESVQSDEFVEMLDKMAGVSNVDEDIDFINDIGDKLQTSAKKGKKKKDSDEEFSDEEGEELDDEEDDFDEEDDDLEEDMDEDEFLGMDDDDKELIGDLGDDDGEDIDFKEEDRDVLKKIKKNKNDLNTLFASADEFASILDDEGSSKVAPGSSRVLSNKDNANVKQLAWEEKRNHWIKGFNNAVSGGNKRKGGGSKGFSSGFSNKNKRKRK